MIIKTTYYEINQINFLTYHQLGQIFFIKIFLVIFKKVNIMFNISLLEFPCYLTIFLLILTKVYISKLFNNYREVRVRVLGHLAAAPQKSVDSANRYRKN